MCQEGMFCSSWYVLGREHAQKPSKSPPFLGILFWKWVRNCWPILKFGCACSARPTPIAWTQLGTQSRANNGWLQVVDGSVRGKGEQGGIVHAPLWQRGIVNQDADSTPTPQRLVIFHLILGGRRESLLRKPGFPY